MTSRPPRGAARQPPIDFDAEALALVREDAAHFPGGVARGIALVEDEAGIAALCAAGLPLLPIGAQSSLTGGATPRDDIVIPLGRFREVTIGDGWVRAGAGVTLDELDAALAPRGLWYPPVPTYTAATVGGIVATNAAGPATFRYGVTRDWVRRLTVVLASGDVLDVERGAALTDGPGWWLETSRGAVYVPIPTYRWPPLPKCSAGYFAARPYDPIDLFIGAEGTLGVVTEVTLRVTPRPPARFDALVGCRSIGEAAALVAGLRSAAERHEMAVASVEHVDARSLALVADEGELSKHEVTLDAGTAVLLFIDVELPAACDDAVLWRAVEGAFDGEADTEPARVVQRLCRLLSAHGADDRSELVFPSHVARRAQLVALREAVPAAVNRQVARARLVDPSVTKMAGDFIVPVEHVEDLVVACEREFSRRGVDAAVWGHISDGNLHPNVLPACGADVAAGREALVALGRQVLAWHGSPLAEHGVGRNPLKQAFLEMLHGADGVAEMRAIKQALDPQWQLSRGVLLNGPAEAGPYV